MVSNVRYHVVSLSGVLPGTPLQVYKSISNGQTHNSKKISFGSKMYLSKALLKVLFVSEYSSKIEFASLERNFLLMG